MSPARMLMLIGGLLMAAGAGLWTFLDGAGRTWSWMGRLPGDIRVDRPGFRPCFPLATCLLASVVLTAPFRTFRRQGR